MQFSFRKVLSAFVCAVLVLSFMMPSAYALAAGETSAPSEYAPSESAPVESTDPSTVPAEPSAAEEETSSAPEPSSSVPEESSSALTEESSASTEPPAESSAATDPAESTAATVETTAPEEEGPELDWNLYFGQLHAHCNISDGRGSVTEAFQYAAQVENLDFFALTDHSDSFDGSDSAAIGRDGAEVSQQWAAGKAAAAAVTDGDFVGIFGFEMSWQEDRRLGHLNTFGTPGFVSRDQAEFTHSLEHYYQALTTAPGSVSQFNHPGHYYGDFENFGHYSAEYDSRICLLEVGVESGFAGDRYYSKALDAGWHVAPTTSQNNHNGRWGDAREDRTVVLASELTEENLLDAMERRRVYATSDGDLTVYYELDGHIMGSILGDRSHPEISVWLSDPTDEEIGQVEVIVDGGRVAASEWLGKNEGELTFRPQGGYSYYYLRITQPDGDQALTAPVWTDSFEDMGIAGFTADTQTPTRGRELNLSAALFNDESIDCRIQALEFSLDGEVIHRVDTAGSLKPRDYFEYSFPYTHPGLGTADFQLTVTGTAAGQERRWTESLTLQFLPEELVAGILVDGSHGSTAPSRLNNFTSLAAQANMDVTVFDGDMPEGGKILLIFAPELEFEEDFIANVVRFAETGGSVILCGQSGQNGSLNRLLEALGSTMRLNADTAVDEINSGQSPDQLYTTVCNRESPWFDKLDGSPVYAHLSGSTVDPGQGTWLVRGFGKTADRREGPVLLAWEATPWGGGIFAAGSPFLCDDAMVLPQNKWAAPGAGQQVAQKLMAQKQPVLPITPIRDLRTGEPGQIYRVRGYVTAGTSSSHNYFPETLYLQDDTGGISVTPFREKGIQVGAPMEITGYLAIENGMPVLNLIDFQLPHESFYRHVPKTVRCRAAMDYGQNGGKLMQVEGIVTSVILTDDEKGVARLTIRDFMGQDAEILIEPTIGADGKNRLADQIKKGRVVRAMGILHLDDGVPVLRVRNCGEVVYVPPRRYPSDNPKTGDWTGTAATVTAISILGLGVLRRKRKSN